MLLHLTTGGPPIYQQIADQIRVRIVSGQLAVGAELPTIRGLAQSNRVNPNTIARAYRELEQEGLVEKRRTTGTFVADRTPRLTASQKRAELSPLVDRLVVHSRLLGITTDELLEQVRQRSNKFNASADKRARHDC